MSVPASRRRRRPASVVIASVLAAGCAGGPPEPDPALVERGAQLYQANCARCHGGPTGGTISDIPPRHNAEGHTWHHSDCLLTQIILDGPAPRPEAGDDFPVMPAFGDRLDRDDVAAILAHIKTWWTDEQRAFQADVTRTECSSS